MRLKDGFALQRLCDENIIVAYGPQHVDYTRIISLNESAALLWRWAEDKEFTATDMADRLMQEYEVDQTTALLDVREMLRRWDSLGLLEQNSDETEKTSM